MSESDAAPAPAEPVPTQPGQVGTTPSAVAPEPASAGDAGQAQPGAPAQPSVPARPSVRPRERGPLTRMGPWAPVAGALVGIVLGVVAAVLLAGTAGDLRGRLSLVFLVIGLGLLGASGTLLADEVRVLRWRAREAALRPAAWIDTTAGLVNGLTPARLLLLAAGFVLFLSAWMATG
jgi:hypothetical protein